jgi:3-methyladenine DNA glycosylase AlkD
MVSTADIMEMLLAKARPENLKGMTRYGMAVEKRFGVSVPDMRKIARDTGINHQLAVELWDTGVAETRILAGMIADPSLLTEDQMEAWVAGIDSWDVCDQVCMNLFVNSPLAWKKVLDWSMREDEFVKRAAFSLIACLCVHDKMAGDEKFSRMLPIIKQCSTDERNFVQKAVNWALRNIGKRNLVLNRNAIAMAREILQIDSKTARWIALDAIKELEGEAVQKRLVEKNNQ